MWVWVWLWMWVWCVCACVCVYSCKPHRAKLRIWNATMNVHLCVCVCVYVFVFVCTCLCARAFLSSTLFLDDSNARLDCPLLVVTNTGWRRCIRCLISVGYFLQKSPIISGSCAENDLQLQLYCWVFATL